MNCQPPIQVLSILYLTIISLATRKENLQEGTNQTRSFFDQTNRERAQPSVIPTRVERPPSASSLVACCASVSPSRGLQRRTKLGTSLPEPVCAP
jgi:hypothetical protein